VVQEFPQETEAPAGLHRLVRCALPQVAAAGRLSLPATVLLFRVVRALAELEQTATCLFEVRKEVFLLAKRRQYFRASQEPAGLVFLAVPLE
jgi:hypothetical protein